MKTKACKFPIVVYIVFFVFICILFIQFLYLSLSNKVYGIDIVKKFIKARMEDMSKEKTYNTESWLTIYNII